MKSKSVKLLSSIFIALASISLSACKREHYYYVFFKTNGGSKVAGMTLLEGSLIPEPECERLGYDLSSWTCENKSWDFSKDIVANDMTLTANWDIIHYSITYNYDGGKPTYPNPDSYTVEDSINFISPSKDGYIFDYFLDQNGNKLIDIAKGTTGDLIITAYYKAESYTVQCNSNRCDVFTVESSFEHYTGDKVEISYSIHDYYDVSLRNSLFLDDLTLDKENKKVTFTMVGHNVTVNFIVSPISYSINYDLDGGSFAGEYKNSYTIEDDFDLPIPSKSNYEFLGWFNENNERKYSINHGEHGDVSLHASWNYVGE